MNQKAEYSVNEEQAAHSDGCVVRLMSVDI